MRTTYRPRCVRRAPSDLERWAKAVVTDPAGHLATPAEAAIVGKLLLQLGAGR